MEKRLRKQLENQEFKPSDSLWDRLEKDLSGDFEVRMRDKMSAHQVEPAPEVWEQIEEALPAETTNPYVYRNVLVGLVSAALFAVALVFVFQSDAPQRDELVVNEPASTAVAPAITRKPGVVESLDNRVITPPSSPAKPAATAVRPEKTKSAEVAAAAPVRSTRSVAVTHKSSRERNTTQRRVNKAILAQLPEKALVQPEQAASNSVAPENKTAILQKPVASEPVVDQPVARETSNPNTAAKNTADQGLKENPSSTNPAEPIAKAAPAEKQSDEAGHKKVSLTDPTDSAASPSLAAAKSDEEFSSRFSFTALAQMNYCTMKLVIPDQPRYDFTKNKALREKLETPDIDWSGSFLINYDLTKRLKISSGISILNFSQQFYYNTATPVVTNTLQEQGAQVVNPNDSIVTGDTYSTRIKYSWTEIPVYLSYRITSGKKFNVSLIGGISYAFLSTADAGMVSYDNVGVLMIKESSAFPGMQNSFFVSFMPALAYNLNEHITLAMMPSFKTSLNSMVSNAGWLQQYPTLTGVGFSITRHF